jgi:hypothetical protein
MSPRRPCLRPSSALASLALLVLLGVAASAADARQTKVSRKPLNPHDGAAVDRAKAGAALRLHDPECLKVLTDFTDDRGRTLEDRLAQWGMSAADYILSIPFFDGAVAPPCKKSRVRLATQPGTFPVFVCPGGVSRLNSQFAEVQARRPAVAEYMVIHEMLHTLGLGENPPSTFEITAKVRKRCHE